MYVAIVLAAGLGERMGAGTPKAFVDLGASTILEVAVARASACPSVDALIVTVPSGFEEQARRLLAGVSRPVTVVTGGATRQASVWLGLKALPEEADRVAVHDAARCLASSELFTAVMSALSNADGVVPVVQVRDTVKRLHDGVVTGTLPDREELVLAQTPQAFDVAVIREAHESAARSGLDFPDDAAVLEWAGKRVVAVPGEETNFKITTRADLARAAAVLGGGVVG